MLLFNPESSLSARFVILISIHLMLLFNRSNFLNGFLNFYFNTSNVTIQLVRWYYLYNVGWHFNTSNVTIQPLVFCTTPKSSLDFNTSNVTIQPFVLRCSQCPFLISIHLMLLFNPSSSYPSVSTVKISIHLMLLFNLY